MSIALTLSQIILLDLSLAADNALVLGLLVAGLPVKRRKRTMAAGIAAATILRVLMAFFAVQLLHITGLLVAGGVLLVWVAWKMVRDYHQLHHTPQTVTAAPGKPDARKMMETIGQIVVADVSMSLDNVLGVAGVARDHMGLLAAGLILSIALMGFASTQVARLAERYPKIALIGTAIVLYTAASMIYDGGRQLTWW